MRVTRKSLPYLSGIPLQSLLFILVVCSGYFTYRGARLVMPPDGALVLAIVSTTAMYLLWNVALNIVPSLNDRAARCLGGMVTGAVGVMVICLSSWMAVAGIAGDSAVIFHYRSFIPAFEKALDERFQLTLAGEELLPDLRQERQLYANRRESEILYGAYSGHPGSPGTIEQILGRLSGRMEGLSHEIESRTGEDRRRSEEARDVLGAMRRTLEGNGDPVRQTRAFAGEADKFRAILAQMSGTGLARSVRRSLEALPGELNVVSISARTRRVAQDQKDALERIGRELAETVERLGRRAETLGGGQVAATPAVPHINAVEAVVRYPVANATFWAVGLAIDLAPGIVIVFLMLIQAARGRRGVAIDSMGKISMLEAVQVYQAISLLRQGRVDGKLLDDLFHEILGQPPNSPTLKPPRDEE